MMRPALRTAEHSQNGSLYGLFNRSLSTCQKLGTLASTAHKPSYVGEMLSRTSQLAPELAIEHTLNQASGVTEM